MSQAIVDRITKDIADNAVVLYMKGSPDFPMCGFSSAVCQVLKNMNVTFKGINILEDAELRQGIKDYSNWPTIPQLYVKGEFIGGCDIVREMFSTGELKKLFKDKGVPFQENAA
ncbi:MAG: Grx4 family monothiol glutaredoxin [Alphaproteobacteria bacterium]|nr:Grx4 family monothiol glutaredoxin [Alphaproteobacteria bacterium]